VGLLDELEQQAQARKATADDAEKRKSERGEIFRAQLDPGMSALYEYLQKLTANLKILKPKTRLTYALGGYGDIVCYVEHEYDLKITSQPGAKEIKLSFPCLIASEECPTVEEHGTGKVKAVAGAFQRYHLGGLLDPKKDASGEVISARFNAKGRIVLSATFSADTESVAMKMIFINFDMLGTLTKSVPAAQLDAAMFDDIGRFLTREPSDLFREALPDSYRNQLRTKVQQDQIKRRWETKINAQQEIDLAQLKRSRSFSGRLASIPATSANPQPESSWLGKLKGLIGKKQG